MPVGNTRELQLISLASSGWTEVCSRCLGGLNSGIRPVFQNLPRYKTWADGGSGESAHTCRQREMSAIVVTSPSRGLDGFPEGELLCHRLLKSLAQVTF